VQVVADTGPLNYLVQIDAIRLLPTGVAFARGRGFAVTGTLGVLDLAARHGLIDLAEAFTRLKATSFHYRQGLLDVFLAQKSGPNR